MGGFDGHFWESGVVGEGMGDFVGFLEIEAGLIDFVSPLVEDKALLVGCLCARLC